MKKVIISLVAFITLFSLTGCEKVKEESGIYKEGTYMGYDTYESYGKKYVTTAVIYVDNKGVIKSCYIDSTYIKDDVNTTKKVLGDNYGMKETSANIGVIPGGGEWYEQVKVIEDKVIAEQNLDWVKYDSTNTKLDSVSGVTISADTYIRAISNAINQAK